MNKKRKTYVYLAGSYTNPDPCINTHKTIKMADYLMVYDYIVFVPHLTHFWHTLSPKKYQDWIEYDKQWLKKCDKMFIMPNSENSNGVNEEIKIAEKNGIEIHYITNERSKCCDSRIIKTKNSSVYVGEEMRYCLECQKPFPNIIKNGDVE